MKLKAKVINILHRQNIGSQNSILQFLFFNKFLVF
jgi:hypothetical protein